MGADDKHPYVGDLVTWRKSGRARGEMSTGKVLKYVPEGMTNEEAVKELREERRDLTILPSYCRMGEDISGTRRVIVAVVVDDDGEEIDPDTYDYEELPPDDCVYYAPNKLKVRPA